MKNTLIRNTNSFATNETRQQAAKSLNSLSFGEGWRFGF
jgi:hypothetical protein